jgi:hypothetical protein
MKINLLDNSNNIDVKIGQMRTEVGMKTLGSHPTFIAGHELMRNLG